MGKANDAARDADSAAAPEATRTASYEINDGSVPAGPAHVGRYAILEALGAGAMGVVYRAHDPDLDRTIAIKLVRPNRAGPSSCLRLLREAQVMARLRHPNVLPIFDVGQAGDTVFLAMPLLESGTLRRWLADGPHSFDAILDRFLAAGRGLAAAHAAGLVHRDVKPDNILVGDGGEIQVADFGLARFADDESAPDASTGALAVGAVTETGIVLGTPAYMAPEQLRNLPIDPRADQFSFCVALWEGIYGARPFPDPPADAAEPLRARFDAIAAGPAPPRSDRPTWIIPLLARGLAADPGRRWPTMQALLDAIAEQRRHHRRRRGPWLAAITVAGVAAVTVAIASSRSRDPTPAFHVSPVTHQDHVRAVAMSPDGETLALVVGDALLIQGIAPGAESHLIVGHGVADGILDVPLAWTPDGRQILFAAPPTSVGLINTQLVDIASSSRTDLPVSGGISPLSGMELATWTYREHSVTISRIGARAAAATCDVPGDYTFVWGVIGMPGSAMVVVVSKYGKQALVILDRDCRVRARFSTEPISSAAASDTGTIVALIDHDDFREVLEISLEGAVISRRRVSGDVEKILGRRHGTDYFSTLALETHLDRVHGAGSPSRQFSVAGNASFSLAPDGETLAWIESGSHGFTRGPLRLSPLRQLSPSGPSVLDDALAVGWSPDGQSLAVVVDTAGPARHRATHDLATALLVIDRRGHVLHRVPVDHLDREAAPVWLDDHRVAVHTEDRTTYRWFDLNTPEQGKIVDSGYGSTYWLTRSPRDGTLAMWRNGPPGAIDNRPEHVWLQDVDHPAHPLHIDDAMKHFLIPSWSRSGELLVRAVETGLVSRVALDTGQLAPIAQLSPIPMNRLFENHLMSLADGDLLAVNVDLGLNVVAAVRDGDRQPSPRDLPQ